MANIKLIHSEWNETTGGYQRDWLADDASQITAGFGASDNPGSTIYCIADQSVYIKNTQGKWQKAGTTEVVE